ncbi:hypothetical protein BKA93DRAFT_741087 [Sparassis latifolia]
MLTYRGFSAWITCEDREVIEYEATIDAKSNRVTCWIPSQEGKNFVVNWRDHGSQVETATYINLDGFVVPGQFLFGEGDAMRSAVRVGEDMERPFVFQRIEGVPRGKDVGTILVRIKRIKRKELRPSNAPQTPPAMTQGRRGIGEPCIGYGEERAARQRFETTWKIEPFDKRNPGAYVVFAFRYRSRGFLVSQDIMSPDDSEFRTPPTPLLASSPPTPVSMSPTAATPSSTPSPSRPRMSMEGRVSVPT